MSKYKVVEILKGERGKTIKSIVQCEGPIPCLSIELDDCWIDIAVETSGGSSMKEKMNAKSLFPAHQIVPKDDETIKARRRQLKG